MDLGWPWRVYAPKVQSFLQQTKPAAEIRQCMNPAGSTQPLEDSRVSLPFRPLLKSFEPASHLFTTHSGNFGIGPKIRPGILLVHFGEALSSRRLDIG